jgi:hypothetical protein
MKLHELKQIIREEVSKVLKEDNPLDSPKKLAKYIAGDFSQDIIPGSEKFIYGPDDEGTYQLKFLLSLEVLKGYNTPEEFRKALQDSIGGSYYSGPGGSFSKTSVSFEKEQKGKFIFQVWTRGGYDI